MANKSSIVSDLHGWRTPSVSGEELQASRKVRPTGDGGIARGLPDQGLNSQRGFGPAVEPRRKSRPRSTSLHGSSPCKCQHLSTLPVGTGCRRAGPPLKRGPRRRPSTERQTTSPLVSWHERIRTLFPRRGRPAGAESCTHLCEEPSSLSGWLERDKGGVVTVDGGSTGHLTRRLFGDMLRRIWALPVPGG